MRRSLIGGVRDPEGHGTSPLRRLLIWPFDRAARLRFLNLIRALAAWDFCKSPISGLFVLAESPLSKTHHSISSIKQGYPFTFVSYETVRYSFSRRFPYCFP